jgi:hypothetical protein
MRMKKVLLYCEPRCLEFFKGTILHRDDIELRAESDINQAIRSILASPPALYLVRGTYEGLLEIHLQSLSFCYPKLPFPVALMSDIQDHSKLPSFVRNVIPLAADTAFFNNVVAEWLDLPTRRSARLPIRIGLNLALPSATTIANTVNMSATGMLVESFKPLTPGKVYQFRFMGLPSTIEVPPISARIVREETANIFYDSTRNYAIEFVNMPVQTMESLISRILG